MPTPPSAIRRILTAWFAVTLWPIHLIGMTPQIRHIKRLDTASGTFKPVTGLPDAIGDRRPRLTAVAATIGVIYLAALFVALGVALTGPPHPSLYAALLLLILVVIPWGAVLSDALRKRREDPLGQRQPKSLAIRSAELGSADGRSYVLTDFVSARDNTGDGVRLIRALAPGWRSTNSIVVFYAATDDLVGYYHDQVNALLDIPSHRRMLLDHRPTSGS